MMCIHVIALWVAITNPVTLIETHFPFPNFSTYSADKTLEKHAINVVLRRGYMQGRMFS